MLNYTEEMNAEFEANQKLVKDDCNRSEKWLDENFTFVKNHLDDNASLDGVMFETYGEELQHVLEQNEDQVWTYAEDDNGDLCIMSGFHVVNRIGYLISEENFMTECGTFLREIFVKIEAE